MPNDDTESHAYDVTVACIYAFFIGVNVYLIVNELTDNALSRSLSLRLSHLRQRTGAWHKQHTTVRREWPRVYWDAINLVEGTDEP